MNRPRIAIPEPTSQDETYNQRSWPQYAAAVESAGGEPVRIGLDSTPAEIARQLAACQGVLLPGSPADTNPQKYGEPRAGARDPDPKREAADELLLQDAFNLQKPVLGICYGLQAMNVWLGGTLIQDLPAAGIAKLVNHTPGREVREAHPVLLEAGSRLFGLAGAAQVAVNSSHHQAVGRLGDSLVKAGVSPEDGVIEAVEARGKAFVVGVQWHPERTADSDHFSQQIFTAFLAAARAWRLVLNEVSGASPSGAAQS
jgi:putative glutamine amidotransferase